MYVCAYTYIYIYIYVCTSRSSSFFAIWIDTYSQGLDRKVCPRVPELPPAPRRETIMSVLDERSCKSKAPAVAPNIALTVAPTIAPTVAPAVAPNIAPQGP